jgi:hypothetical protein
VDRLPSADAIFCQRFASTSSGGYFRRRSSKRFCSSTVQSLLNVSGLDSSLILPLTTVGLSKKSPSRLSSWLLLLTETDSESPVSEKENKRIYKQCNPVYSNNEWYESSSVLHTS